MKENMEFERDDMYVDRDIQLDSENKQQIVAYLETLFDVNKKFNLQLDSEASEWVNMYGIYNPLSDFLIRERKVSIAKDFACPVSPKTNRFLRVSRASAIICTNSSRSATI